MRKRTLVSMAVVLILGLPGTSAEAAKDRKRKETSQTGSQSDTVVVSSSSASGPQRTGLGLTSITIGNGILTSGVGSIPAFSGWFDLNAHSSIQAFLGIGGTNPFSFGMGGIYRATVSGGQTSGLHVGGGINFGTFRGATVTGTGSNFYVSFSPVAGLHFSMPNLSNVGFSFDGGVNFMIMDGSFDMNLGGLSGLLGLSVHYFL